jgi:hypothetical protein
VKESSSTVTITTTIAQMVRDKQELEWWRNAALVFAYRLSVERGEPVSFAARLDMKLIEGSKLSVDLAEATTRVEVADMDAAFDQTLKLRVLEMDAE